MISSFILVPFFLLVMLNLPFAFLRGRIAFWLTGAVLLRQVALTIIHPWFFWSTFLESVGKFFAFNLSLDALSLLMLFTIGVVALVSLIVAQSTITTQKRRFNFVNLLLIAVIGMNTAVLTTDIFSLYVFIELTAVAVFVLMALEQNQFAVEGTFKYLALSMLASVFILASIAFFMLVTGDISFAGIHDAFSVEANDMVLRLATALFLCGVLIKCGLIPFHGWVPDAYSEAPAAVSVLLAGIVTKIAGVYALLRLFSSVFVLNDSFRNVIMSIGIVSIVVAAFAALRQGNIKRMLSYSSISQIGYIALAIGCGTPLAFLGAVVHFFNHAIFKSLLFVNAASLEKKFGSTDTRIITGLGGQLPVTSFTSLVGMLSTAGLPPLSGFWSKFIIIFALFSSGRYAYGSIALLASAMTLAYFLFLERSVFFIKSEMISEEGSGIPFGIKFSEILLAAIVVAVGAGFPFILNVALLHVKELLR